MSDPLLLAIQLEEANKTSTRSSLVGSVIAYTRRWCNSNDKFDLGAFIYTETTYCFIASNTRCYIIESLFLCRRLRFGIWFLVFHSSSQRYSVFFCCVGKLIWADAVGRSNVYIRLEILFGAGLLVSRFGASFRVSTSELVLCIGRHDECTFKIVTAA